MTTRVFLSFVLLCFLTFCITGCGPSYIKTDEVSGTITYNGDPLPNATVTFHPQSKDGLSGYANTDEKGAYKIQALGGAADAGTVPGEYTVTVFAQKKVPSGKTEFSESSGKEEEIMNVTTVTPAKYNKPDSSGLKATVVKGKKNVFDFPLEGPPSK